MYPGTIVPCDPSVNPEAAYYQMDSPPPPPCYTIATGLPTYDEALHHHHQQFAFGMKFIYPTLAAVHHQASTLMSSWEKYDMHRGKDQGKTVTASPTKQSKSLKCKSAQTNGSKINSTSGAVSASSLMMPPSYDVAASMALLAPEPLTSDSVSITITPQMVGSADSLTAAAETSSDLTDIITV